MRGIILGVLLLVVATSACCKMDDRDYLTKELPYAVRRLVKLLQDERDELRREKVDDHGYDPRAITEAPKVLTEFLNSPLGQSFGSTDWVQREKILGFVTQYSYTLASVTVMFSISAGLCAYDYQLHQLHIMAGSDILRQVDVQLRKLKLTVDEIGDLMERATAHFQHVVAERTLQDSKDIDYLLNQINSELKAGETRAENVAKLLVNIEEPARASRADIMARNELIFGGVTIAAVVVGVVRREAEIAATGHQWTRPAIGMVASVFPLLHSYFSLGYAVETLAADRRTREARITLLRTELDICRQRFGDLQAQKRVFG
jgi:hypothetical protein